MAVDTEQQAAAEALREYQERAHLLQQLTEHRGWPVFMDRLRHDLTQRQKVLLEGRARDMEHYSRLTGYIQGMVDCGNIPVRVAEEAGRAAAGLEAMERNADADNDPWLP